MERTVHPRHGGFGAYGAHHAVGLHLEVGMAVVEHIIENLGYEAHVEFMAVGVAVCFGVLLESPDAPQRDVGEVYALYAVVEAPCLHEVYESLAGGGHYRFIVLAVVDGDCIAGERHEGVAGENLSPGIAREEEHSVLIFQIELFGGVFKAVEEA